jgi:hypothetical protein
VGADALQQFPPGTADGTISERPPLAEDPNLIALLERLDRGLFREVAHVEATLRQPPLIERLVIPAGGGRQPAARCGITLQIERTAIAALARWMEAAAVVLAISLGVLAASVALQEEVSAIAAGWSASEGCERTPGCR